MISNTGKLAGRTLFITGASRGIGKAIALKAARDGANIVIASKTVNHKQPETIYTAAEEIEKAGGKALPCVVDIQNDQQVKDAVSQAVAKFGGIDILVNNASAVSLSATTSTDMKRFDLMHNINTRGTFLVSKECLPFLTKSNHAHILNISPPLNLDPSWFADHVAYTMAKYGMSMCVLGMAAEFKDTVAVNALWPRTAIKTAFIDKLYEGSNRSSIFRKPEIMADAAYVVLSRKPNEVTGKFLIDDEVLTAAGVKDMKQYACDPANSENLLKDFFLGIKNKADLSILKKLLASISLEDFVEKRELVINECQIYKKDCQMDNTDNELKKLPVKETNSTKSNANLSTFQNCKAYTKPPGLKKKYNKEIDEKGTPTILKMSSRFTKQRNTKSAEKMNKLIVGSNRARRRPPPRSSNSLTLQNPDRCDILSSLAHDFVKLSHLSLPPYEGKKQLTDLLDKNESLSPCRDQLSRANKMGLYLVNNNKMIFTINPEYNTVLNMNSSKSQDQDYLDKICYHPNISVMNAIENSYKIENEQALGTKLNTMVSKMLTTGITQSESVSQITQNQALELNPEKTTINKTPSSETLKPELSKKTKKIIDKELNIKDIIDKKSTTTNSIAPNRKEIKEASIGREILTAESEINQNEALTQAELQEEALFMESGQIECDPCVKSKEILFTNYIKEIDSVKHNENEKNVKDLYNSMVSNKEYYREEDNSEVTNSSILSDIDLQNSINTEAAEVKYSLQASELPSETKWPLDHTIEKNTELLFTNFMKDTDCKENATPTKIASEMVTATIVKETNNYKAVAIATAKDSVNLTKEKRVDSETNVNASINKLASVRKEFDETSSKLILRNVNANQADSSITSGDMKMNTLNIDVFTKELQPIEIIITYYPANLESNINLQSSGTASIETETDTKLYNVNDSVKSLKLDLSKMEPERDKLGVVKKMIKQSFAEVKEDVKQPVKMNVNILEENPKALDTNLFDFSIDDNIPQQPALILKDQDIPKQKETEYHKISKSELKLSQIPIEPSYKNGEVVISVNFKLKQFDDKTVSNELIKNHPDVLYTPDKIRSQLSTATSKEVEEKKTFKPIVKPPGKSFSTGSVPPSIPKTPLKTNSKADKAKDLKPAEKTNIYTGKIGGLFKVIQSALSSDIVDKTKALYQFDVTGTEKGTWYLNLKDSPGSVGKGTPKGRPDAILTMDTEHFLKMFGGELKPAVAFMMGKLKISGDLQKAMKLEKLMSKLKSKL